MVDAARRSFGAGTIMGGIGGFGKGEGGLENRLGEAGTDALIGGAVGLVAPYIGAGLGKVISPFKTSPERKALVDALKREGVDVTAGQRTGSRTLRLAEGEFGGQMVAEKLERQGEQLTSAALKRAEIRANRATAKVIDDAYTRIGAKFDGVAARQNLVPDRGLFNDMQNVANNYLARVPESLRAPVVERTVRDVIAAASSPQGIDSVPLSAKAYQAIRLRLEKMDRISADDAHLVDALRGLREAVDDAMERSISRNNPADLGAWQEARRQYQNLMVLEKAVASAGDNAGLISPSRLGSAAYQQSRRGLARGKDDFNELVRAGEAIMKPLSRSDSAGRTAAARILETAIPATIGAIGGSAAGGATGTMAGIAAGAAFPQLVGALMMSKAGQKLLANQAASSPAFRDLVSALIVSGSAARLPAPPFRDLVSSDFDSPTSQ